MHGHQQVKPEQPATNIRYAKHIYKSIHKEIYLLRVGHAWVTTAYKFGLLECVENIA